MSAVTLLNWSSWRWLSPPWQVKTWSVKWVDWWSSPVWPSLTRLICSYRHPHHLRCHHYIRCHLHYSVVVVITMNIINDSWSDHHSPIAIIVTYVVVIIKDVIVRRNHGNVPGSHHHHHHHHQHHHHHRHQDRQNQRQPISLSLTSLTCIICSDLTKSST